MSLGTDLHHPVQIVATVPDLIAVLDAQSGCAFGTPDYKYGLRVFVLGITAAPQWTSTARGLELGDLRAFGYVLFQSHPFPFSCRCAVSRVAGVRTVADCLFCAVGCVGSRGYRMCRWESTSSRRV